MAKKDRNYLLYLEDMIINLGHCLEYVEGMDFEMFANDTKTQNAVVRCLEVTGEAAKNVPEFVKERNTEVDWDLMYLFRNKVAHHYFDIDLSLVWHIVSVEVSRDLNFLKAIFEREEKLFNS